MFLLSHKTAASACRTSEGERGMALEINFNLNYKMRDGKILHKGLRFWGGGRGRSRERERESKKRKKTREEKVEKQIVKRFLHEIHHPQRRDEPAVTRERIKCRWQ